MLPAQASGSRPSADLNGRPRLPLLAYGCRGWQYGFRPSFKENEDKGLDED
jgi:hypothetical protein